MSTVNIFSTRLFTFAQLQIKQNTIWASSLRVMWFQVPITKTRLYNFDPLEPHFYIVKLGFTGVCIIFLISAQNIDCGYSFEPPRRGGSNEYPQSMFWAEIWKISDFFLWKFSFFLVVKFSVHLNRRVFVMRLNCANAHCIKENIWRKNKCQVKHDYSHVRTRTHAHTFANICKYMYMHTGTGTHMSSLVRTRVHYLKKQII